MAGRQMLVLSGRPLRIAELIQDGGWSNWSNDASISYDCRLN
jgi:hypothetical protein